MENEFIKLVKEYDRVNSEICSKEYAINALQDIINDMMKNRAELLKKHAEIGARIRDYFNRNRENDGGRECPISTT